MIVKTERIQEIEDESMIAKYYDSLTAKEFIWEYLEDHKKQCFEKYCEIENVLENVLKKL